MKTYKFSKAAKSQMRRQLSNSILFTTLLFIIFIGLMIMKKVFYGRLVLVFALLGVILTISIIKKVRRVGDIAYIKLYSDKIQVNNNVTLSFKTFYFRDMNNITLTDRGIKFFIGHRNYRIFTHFLEKDEVIELWNILSKERS